MKWTILDSDITGQDPSGVERFIQRLDEELRVGGLPLEGFKFLNSGKEMLRITREIENDASAAGGQPNLYVGFQTSAKLHNETDRYRRMKLAGVQVVGFGQGGVTEETAELLEQWVNLPDDTKAFENQWYLVMTHPFPILFIGWETSSPEMFGRGGISNDDKQFKGFVSIDRRAIKAVIDHLERVRRRYGPGQPMCMNGLADKIPFPVRQMLVLTDDGQSPQLAAMREASAEFAVKKSSSILLYDLSGGSFLTSPYPSEEYEHDFNRPIDKKDLNRFGRRFLVNQLEEFEARGVSTRVILPVGHGFVQLAERASRANVDLIVIPDYLEKPSLIDRIKGYTLKNLLDTTDIPLLVYRKDGRGNLQTKAILELAASG